MDNADVNTSQSFLKLLLLFNALPRTKASRTFMEVSGYPHYENVCSNILGFYFDNTAEHGFGDLFIKAFLKMAKKESVVPGIFTVGREYGTEKNGRLDLIIEGGSFIIAIENKIFHWIANDLDDYSKTVHSLTKNKQIVIKVVLGLNAIKGEKQLRGGFESYTYNQFWQEIRNLLGSYIAQANPKWGTYLLDFMETTTNLAGQNMELKQTDQFFIEHNDIIEIMMKERNAFLGRLTQKIAMLIDILSETSEVTALATPPYPYSKDRLVLDFEKLGGSYDISFDLYLTPAGWNLQLFGRGTESYVHLMELVNQPAMKEKMQFSQLREKRFYVQEWDVRSDIGEIVDSLRGWLLAVIAAENSLQGVE